MDTTRILLLTLLAALVIMWIVKTSSAFSCTKKPDTETKDQMHPELRAKLNERSKESGILIKEGQIEDKKQTVMKGGNVGELTGVFVLEDGRKGQFMNAGDKAQLDNGVIVEVVDGEVPLDSVIDENQNVKKIVAFESESDESEIPEDEPTTTTSEPVPVTTTRYRIDGLHNTQTSLLIPTSSDVDEKHVRDLYEFYKNCNTHTEPNRVWKFKSSLSSTVCADDDLPHCTKP